jgi:hypothetical protein
MAAVLLQSCREARRLVQCPRLSSRREDRVGFESGMSAGPKEVLVTFT